MPREPLVVEPEDYKGDCYSIFAVAGGAMGPIFSGCARAANALALDYAHDRKQGGTTILQRQSVEKILRDTRASMIEDGRNEVLAIRGGGMLVNPELI